MHLKPINRQGKKRKKMKVAPSLSCEWKFAFQPDDDSPVPKLDQAFSRTAKKDQAAA